MPEHTVKTRFFEFRQNNSGGHFDIDDARGIGPQVWVEAANVEDAAQRAESIGIYFDGCEKGMDCPCCGDRWSQPWDVEGGDAPEINPDYDFHWHDTVYVHAFGGSIKRIKQGEAP